MSVNNLTNSQVALGDCIEFMNSLPENSVDMVFADPPYNMRLEKPLFRPDRSAVDTVDDEWDQFDTPALYDDFTARWMLAARRVLKDTGTIWVIGSYHNIYRVGKILMDCGFWILNDIVWIKSNPTPQMRGVRFCGSHETLIWAKKDRDSRHTFNYHALKGANEDLQARSDWYIPKCSGPERVKIDGTKAHPTQKPEALLRRVIHSSSNPGDTVLDPFGGSGTTAAVCKKLGRNCLSVDQDPVYVDVARRRLEQVESEDWTYAVVPVVTEPKRRVPFADLVETGVLPSGTKLRLKNTSITGLVNSDGTITASNLRGSIHMVGRMLLGTESCNGWEKWLYQINPDDDYQLINNLRQSPYANYIRSNPDIAAATLPFQTNFMGENKS